MVSVKEGIMVMKIEKSWHEQLQEELNKPYVHQIKEFLQKEWDSNQIIYPPKDLIFNAMRQTPFNKVKAVIIGQDPYHGHGQAHGLCFSVPKGVTPPPSLKNIFKELQSDLGIPIPSHGCLTAWAEQGVFLLNATLTVKAGQPKSHYGIGWEQFTDAIIDLLAKGTKPLLFLLWGASARAKQAIIKSKGQHHLVLESAHPSPYSAADFFGCKHFSKANNFLIKTSQEPIDWNVDN